MGRRQVAGWFADNDRDKGMKMVDEAQKTKPRMGPVPKDWKAADVEFCAGVQDSLLKSFCAYVTDTCVVKKLLHHFYSTNGVRPFETLLRWD